LKLRIGYHGTQKVPPPSAVIKKVLAEIKDLPAEAEQEAKTVVELKKENTDLKRKVKDFATGNIVLLDTSITPEKHKKAIQEAVAIQVKAFEKERKYFQRQLQSFFDNAKKIHSLSDPTSIEEVMKTRFTDIFSPEALEPAEEIKIIPGSPTFDFSKVKKTTGITFAQNTDYVDKDGIAVGAINKGEREILTAIAQHENITTEHIAVLTGYKNTSRREYLRKLIARGYIAKEGEGYSVTDFGLQGLGDFTPLPTGSDLLHHYKQTLPDGERKLFEAMLLQHPDPVDRTTLENETGYKATSTREYLRKLIARKIVINEKGVYKLTDKLF
jgi:transcription initiation factor IIE alpha subunit